MRTHSFLSEALEAGRKNVVTKIIQAKGTDVLKCYDRLGQQPLHYCIANHNMDMAKYFLQKGADLNAKDKTGWTPLHVRAHHVKCVMAHLCYEDRMPFRRFKDV